VSKKQRTLAKPVDIDGIGLFFGRPVSLRCLPAEANTGIVFVRTDLHGRPSVPATIEYLLGPQRWTAIRNGEAEVFMIEHLLAAAVGLGIDNMTVETDAAEMPIGDCSATAYVEPFLAAGAKELDEPQRTLHLPHPLSVSESDIALMAAPQENALTVTYTLDYGQHFLRTETGTFTIDQETFVRDIAPARTYVLRPEVDAFLKQGLGKGASPENTIVLEDNGDTSIDLRFPDECVRHKILDLIGDLFLAGGRLAARILAYKSGHGTNVQLARKIRETCLTPAHQPTGNDRKQAHANH